MEIKVRKYVDDSCVLVYIVLECYKIIIISLKNYKLHASILLTVDTEHFNEIISYTHKRIYVFIHHLSSSILRRFQPTTSRRNWRGERSKLTRTRRLWEKMCSLFIYLMCTYRLVVRQIELWVLCGTLVGTGEKTER